MSGHHVEDMADYLTEDEFRLLLQGAGVRQITGFPMSDNILSWEETAGLLQALVRRQILTVDGDALEVQKPYRMFLDAVQKPEHIWWITGRDEIPVSLCAYEKDGMIYFYGPSALRKESIRFFYRRAEELEQFLEEEGYQKKEIGGLGVDSGRCGGSGTESGV